jgi:hypothetical protein
MSTVPNTEDAAIAALQATDADEDTTAGLLVTAYTNSNAQVASLTKQLADAIAANNPLQVAARLKALTDLNATNAATAAKMKTALAAPVPGANTTPPTA